MVCVGGVDGAFVGNALGPIEGAAAGLAVPIPNFVLEAGGQM